MDEPRQSAAGHDWIYRVTIESDKPRRTDTAYYLTADLARIWRDKVRELPDKPRVAVARVPAAAFVDLADDELDTLADKEPHNG